MCCGGTSWILMGAAAAAAKEYVRRVSASKSEGVGSGDPATAVSSQRCSNGPHHRNGKKMQHQADQANSEISAERRACAHKF